MLARILDAGRADGVPVVDPLTGALLHALVLATGATRVLEIGTAIGYSTLWMVAALPPAGLLLTLERDPARATTARTYLAEVGNRNKPNECCGATVGFDAWAFADSRNRVAEFFGYHLKGQ